MLAASRSNSPDAMNAVIAGTQAASIQGQLNFSRDVEREADRIGFQVMTNAGYAPGGMASMFEKMDVSTRLNDFGGFPYLRSHPLTTERIGEARARAGIATAAPRVSVLEHTVAQARSRVLMDTRVDALRRWEARDADTEGLAADKLRAATEGALGASLLRDWARADASFARALAITRSSPNSSTRAERAVVLMQAQSYLDRNDPARAAEAMKAFATEGSRPSLLLEAQIALIANPAVSPDSPLLKARAAELQTWVALHADDALAWSSLGQTWARLGGAAALATRRCRIALCAWRPARCRRPPARRPARGPQRRKRRLHRRLGDRFTVAGDRGAEEADRGGSAGIEVNGSSDGCS